MASSKIEKTTQKGIASSSTISSAIPHQQLTSPPPVLQAYTDYRQYLKDVYQWRCCHWSSTIRPYSYAMFSAAADIKSPQYLRMIIHGERNLSEEMIPKFARALKLNRHESEEFRLLVLYNQSREGIQRNTYLKELCEWRAEQQYKNGEYSQDSWEKVPNWLGWLLYAMVDQAGVDLKKLETIQNLIRIPVRLEEIRDALNKLLQGGELEETPSGSIQKPKQLKGAQQQNLPPSLIRKLQAELVDLGVESLLKDEATEREIGALTLSLSTEEAEALRFELRQLRKRWHKDISVRRQNSKGDKVYQLNIQLFPLTYQTNK